MQKTPKSKLNRYIKASTSKHINDNSYSNEKLKTPNKNNTSSKNSNNSFSTPEQLTYNSRLNLQEFTSPSGKSPRIVRRKLFDEVIDSDIITQAIEYMNLTKQGVISLNNFNMEEIYSRSTFEYQFNKINTTTPLKYKLNDISLCDDLNSKILFTTIFNVFCNPVNCGYFNENELDFIYSIITLPINAQMLLARMIKRSRKWFRKCNIKYPEIGEELKDTFEILVSRSICTFDIKDEQLSTILELLHVNEIQQLCKSMKINFKGNKESNIEKLIKLSKTKPLFPGLKAPRDTLYAAIFNILGYCVSVSALTWNTIDKIITLLIPNQYPQKSIADMFHMLCNIYLGKIVFPNISKCYFPVFSNEIHLTSYINAKSILFTMLQYIEKKNWKEVQKYGKLAMDILPMLLKDESSRLKHSVLPMHIRCYMPGYTWMKILSTSIEAFKKDKDKTRVVEILLFLLEQNCHMNMNKGKWYNELVSIEMYYHKNIETSASFITKALNIENLTQVDKINLMERAKKILKKKVAIKPVTKVNVNKALANHIHNMPKYEPVSITIDATGMQRNTTRSKSIWCIKNDTEGQSYGSVETVAFNYYCEQGFPNGLHCEGALPNILFCTLFWEELYDIHIPGTFVTSYQEAPSDLFTEQFYENRKEKIDLKLQIASNLNLESLSFLMEEKFIILRQYQSIMISNLQNNLQLKEIVQCLGVQGVIGICKRLIDNFKLWKAGFPDLIVWNYETKEVGIHLNK
ncbi:Fanconi-associated nuclease 1 [Eufriesea mexicana]|uniref:Fanconi-associated nuclease n=1 Tax=Eufriesea mexicana TaxID=516756 RepID=A0A310SI32_9HYME|nr:Fanconi-associated nuclease 1 [Eufriesea mexicana]